VGTPGSGNGTVTILYGSHGGLTSTGSMVLTGRSAAGRFGATLASGDVTGDHVDDIAVSEPGKKSGTMNAAGEVIVIKGVLHSTILGPGSTGWSQSTAGVPGDPTAADSFGTSLAAGDTNGDGRADLAIGVPGETTAGTNQHQGMV